jgi:hypothetical protein
LSERTAPAALPAHAPPFIVVTGLPASGKSTVATLVGAGLGLPVIDKDTILEALFDALGAGDRQRRTALSRAADAVMQRLARETRGCVLVSWWRHPRSDEASGTPMDWLAELPGRLVELHCRCAPATAISRFLARQRHAGHLDRERSAEVERARFDAAASRGPAGTGELLQWDTEQPPDAGALLAAIAATLGRAPPLGEDGRPIRTGSPRC